MSPQAIPPRRPPPRAWRWLIFIGLALVLAAWLATRLLPRLGGRLPGLDWGKRGGTDWSQVEVVWESAGAPAGPASPASDAAPAADTPAPIPAAERPAATAPGSGPAAAEPARPAGPAAAGGEASAGSGGPAAAPGPSSAAPGRDSPRILQAAWPSRALLAGLRASGRLRYRLRVEPDGRVSAHELLDDGGFDCDPCRREAERIIGELRFAPGTVDGRPVACWVPYEISFDRGGR
ncbi:hypothetical protein FJ251_11250 [bacterium]|nr:hypothetical protein [bacterium]